MHIYNFSEAIQNFTSILQQAILDGGVQINSEEGQAFMLTPVNATKSPLDIKSIPLNLTVDEIVDFVHEGRK